MNQLLQCPKGHQWPDPSVSDATTAPEAMRCPVCGAQAVSGAKDLMSDISTHEMTLSEDSLQAKSLPVSDTLAEENNSLAPSRVKPPPKAPLTSIGDPNASERTAPTVLAGPGDETTTLMPDSQAPALDQSGATVPLTHHDQEAIDRTAKLADGEDDPSRTAGDEDEERTEAEDDDEQGLLRTVPADHDSGEGSKTSDQTEATAAGRPTDFPQRQGSPTGKRGHVGPTRPRKLKPVKDVQLPDKIPGYEILGELGRGGMGVVYKARQTGLNRLCALKMIIGGGMASKDAIARFKVEAEAIAHLQHPNVVQVYETGEANGCPFFSLEFVEGSNLQVKIASTPQPAAETARLMQQICDGVYAAHQRGVLHRDLKPANVLMTKDNVPKITDFGLAKRLEEQDQGQTRTGAILGTPSYMAPEQAMGKAKQVGPAADIYSLGAVLYDMLTGRPPFRGETVMDTLNQVQTLEPLPPERLAPKVPHDLQTICLKALQKDPIKRYATAGAMGEDLRRFLAGEPILARPTPAWERAVKWVKRRPALATLVSVSSVAILSLLVTGGLWLNTERLAAQDRQEAAENKYANERKLKEAAENLAKVETEAHQTEEGLRKQADELALKAHNAVNDMLTSIGYLNFAYEPRIEEIRKKLVEKALNYNLGFLKDRAGDPALRYETGLAYYRVADIYKSFNNFDLALTNYDQALEHCDELLAKFPKDEKYRVLKAASIMEEATIWHLQNHFAESEKGYRRSLELFDGLTKEFPTGLVYQASMASLFNHLGSLCVQLSRFGEAQTDFDESLRLRNSVIAKGFNAPDSRLQLARLQSNRAVFLLKVGKAAEAEKALLSARDVLAVLAKQESNIPDYRSDWAASFLKLAICYGQTGRPKLADEAISAAIPILKKLTDDFPRTPVYRQELARSIYESGMIKGLLGDIQKAHDQFAAALEIQKPLFDSQPKVTALRVELARSQISMGIALVHLNKAEEALTQYQTGVELLEAIKPSAKTSEDACNELARGHQNLAELLTALNKAAEADRSWERLLTLREELVQAFPQSPDYHYKLALTHGLFAGRYSKADKDAEATKQGTAALAELRQAIDNGFRDINALKTALEFEILRGRPEFQRLVSELQAKAPKKKGDLISLIPFPRFHLDPTLCVGNAPGRRSASFHLRASKHESLPLVDGATRSVAAGRSHAERENKENSML